jgi:penicillin-insensitive murein endopeptidase
LRYNVPQPVRQVTHARPAAAPARATGAARARAALAGAVLLVGCGRAPSPLAPQLGGSVGVPHRGVLTGGAELAPRGEGWVWLRSDDRHHGLPRFVRAIERVARDVARERPGALLAVGDLSARGGGTLMPHLSHRSGRDADLLLYVTTLEGAPVPSPGFVHVGADGLAWDEEHKRFLRFDVERQWLLVKGLVEDEGARIQWIFVSRDVEAMLVEWARARGERPEIVARAMDVMLQPKPGGVHDDHVHIRTACTPTETWSGCEPTGPIRAWIAATDAAATEAEPVGDLVASLLAPISAAAPRGAASAAESDANERP